MEAMQPRCHETFTWRRDVNGLELDAQTLEDHGDAVLGVLDLQTYKNICIIHISL